MNPSLNWVRLAQRIPVRIALDEPPADLRMVAEAVPLPCRCASPSARDKAQAGPEGQKAQKDQKDKLALAAKEPPAREARSEHVAQALLPALVPLLFAACTTVGPDYHVPDNAAVKAQGQRPAARHEQPRRIDCRGARWLVAPV